MLLIEEAFAKEVAKYIQRLGTARTEEVGRSAGQPRLARFFLLVREDFPRLKEWTFLYDMLLVLICNIHCWDSITCLMYHIPKINTPHTHTHLTALFPCKALKFASCIWDEFFSIVFHRSPSSLGRIYAAINLEPECSFKSTEQILVNLYLHFSVLLRRCLRWHTRLSRDDGDVCSHLLRGMESVGVNWTMQQSLKRDDADQQAT